MDKPNTMFYGPTVTAAQGPGNMFSVANGGVQTVVIPEPASDLAALETCRTELTKLRVNDADRVLKFLQDWNRTRPAEDK